MYFHIGGEYLKVKEFYNLDELKKDMQWLDIGTVDEGNRKLCLNLTTSKLAIKENDNIYKELHVDFEEFVREPQNYSH